MKIFNKGRIFRILISVVLFCAKATAGASVLAGEQIGDHPDSERMPSVVMQYEQGPHLYHGTRIGWEEKWHRMSNSRGKTLNSAER